MYILCIISWIILVLTYEQIYCVQRFSCVTLPVSVLGSYACVKASMSIVTIVSPELSMLALYSVWRFHERLEQDLLQLSEPFNRESTLPWLVPSQWSVRSS